MKLSVAIVLYNNDREVLTKAIKSTLNTDLDIRLYLLDNSPQDDLRNLGEIDDRIEYIFNNANDGFGAGHNVVLKKETKLGQYHLVLNPDVYFEPGVLESLFQYMDANPTVAVCIPKVLNEDGTIQNLPRLLPTPTLIVLRRLGSLNVLFKKKVVDYEMRSISNDLPSEVSFVSGCFSFMRSQVATDIGGYDDAFFMYFEDWDISRRMAQYGKLMYYPGVAVTHGYESGASKSFKLFKVFISSMITYFNKWGWFFDKERTVANRRALQGLKK